MTHWDPHAELHERIAVLLLAAKAFPGVNEIEHLLVGLLELLVGGRLERRTASSELVRLMDAWEAGTTEILEFTMRRLQWQEIREALTSVAESHPDFRVRDAAKQVLEVYEDEWGGGEIYRSYREA